jgi:hypothetical protein
MCLDRPETTFYDAHSLAIVLKASKAVIQVRGFLILTGLGYEHISYQRISRTMEK